MRTITFLISVFLISCGAAQEEKKETSDENKKTATKVEIEKEQEGMHDETRPMGFITISVDEFEKQIQQPCTILDVRTPEETALGMIKGAVEMNINGDDFANQIQTLDKTKPVCVYCKAGGRSANAADILTGMGYTVYNLDGGYDAWKAAGK